MAKKKRGRRYPLLLYTHVGKRWNRFGILIIVASAILIVLSFTRFLPLSTPMRLAVFLPLLLGVVLVVYSYAARNMAYVQCLPTKIRIQSPIYPLVVSINRFERTRPVPINKIFDPEQDKAARRSWPQKYWGMTALVLEMKSMPLEERWLRLWFNRYMFWPQGIGFVLLVEDWLELSRELDGYWSDYRAQRMG